MFKRFTIYLLLFISVNVSYGQDNYFYQGKLITLEQRTDKAVVVLNSNFFSKEQKSESIDNVLSSGSETKEISDNVYLINFNENKSASEIQNFISVLLSRNSLIKLVAPAYYGESKRVTQLPGDEFIVRLKNVKDKEKLDIINANNNIVIIGNVSNERGFLLKSNDGVRKNALELSDIYFKTGLFEYAEPNFIYPEGCLLTMTPNDPLYPLQWALNNTGQSVPTGGDSTNGDHNFINGIPNSDIDANLAWDFTTGSSTIKIGVVDTGIDSTHPDFNISGHLMTGYDAVYNKYGVPKDSGDLGGHGTCTAGLVGALTNNGVGTAGVAPGCRIMAFRIFNKSLSSTIIGIGRAFDTATVLGIHIMSNSWNGGTASTTVTNAINNAALNGRGGLGCIILVTAGNDGRNSVWYPSYLSNAVSVGASTPHDQKKSPGTGNQYWWGANYGENENGDLDVVAPTDCYTTDIQGAFGYNNTPGPAGNYFKSFNGTSCACPQVSGIAALILSINPSFTRLEVMDRIYRGCDKIDNVDYSKNKTYGKWNDYCGYGRVNAYHSVRLAAGIDVTPPTINHKNIYSHSSTFPTQINAEILDQDGTSVPVSGVNQPKLLYRINKLESGWSLYDTLTASLVTGNNFSFYIPGLGYETQVQYYITARDNLGNQSSFPKGSPHNFWLCSFSVGNFLTEKKSTGAFNCSESGVTYSPLLSFNNFRIVNTKVEIYLRHNQIRDEIIELYSPNLDPNNNRKCLFASNGGTGANINGAIVTDTANQFWGSGAPPYSSGLFRGDYLLNGLNGTSAGGNWKILNYDQFAGNAANYDSVIVSFTRTAGIASPSARHDSPSDTILNFGNVNYPDSVIRNFYLKNAGTDTLTVNGIYFTGPYSFKFSVLNLAPVRIIPDDSMLFFVLLKTDSQDTTIVVSDAIENAVMNFNTDDPSKSVFKVSLQTENILQQARTLNLKLFIQGFYDTLTNSTERDTIKVYLRNALSPYTIIDSSRAYIDSSGTGSFLFFNASDSVDYILQIVHRNSIRTWSKLPGQRFISNTMQFDLSSDSSQAVGYNLLQVDSNPVTFAMYNGDANQDGLVDGTDMLLIDNDVVLLVSGYVPTDTNGDGFIDGTDSAIASNNAAEYIYEISP
ncbi:MAG: S8 family serine peptidase [Ignavibacteria bacterium]